MNHKDMMQLFFKFPRKKTNALSNSSSLFPTPKTGSRRLNDFSEYFSRTGNYWLDSGAPKCSAAHKNDLVEIIPASPRKYKWKDDALIYAPIFPCSIVRGLQLMLLSCGKKLFSSTDYDALEDYLFCRKITDCTKSSAKKILSHSARMKVYPAGMDMAVFDAVYNAVMGEKPVSFEYNGASGSRNISAFPEGMVVVDDMLYLVATEKDQQEPKIFKLCRISNLQEIEDEMEIKAIIPSGKDINKMIEEGYFFYRDNKEPFINLELKFLSKNMLLMMQEEPISKNQKITENEDSFTVKARVPNNGQLKWWILSHGERVEVIKPDSLRQQIAKTAKAMNNIY